MSVSFAIYVNFLHFYVNINCTPHVEIQRVIFGGEGGIRTLDTLPYTHFPGVLLQPLGHLTIFFCLAGTPCVLPFRRGATLGQRAYMVNAFL